MKACIVTGTREGRPEQWRKQIMDAIAPYDIVIEGGQRKWDPVTREWYGIDWIAGCAADELGKEHRKRPADWNRHGRAGGPIRNQQMLDELLDLRDWGYEIAVLAFHHDLDHSAGTGGMVRFARAAGVRVEVVP